MTKYKPLKRSTALLSLSKDHHLGLLLVWKIRCGIRADIHPHRINEYLLFSFDEELQPHFLTEEEIIFPLFDNDDPMRKRAEAEHAAIRDIIAGVRRDNTNTNLAEQLAIALEMHIRFEERELFNHIQDTTPPNILEQVCEKLSPKNKALKTTWPDMFWLNVNI